MVFVDKRGIMGREKRPRFTFRGATEIGGREM